MLEKKKAKKTQGEKVAHIEDDSLKKSKKEKVSFEDDVIRVFDPVLDSDEQIIKAYKPCKAKVFLSNLLLGSIPFLCLVLLAVLLVIIPTDSQSKMVVSEIVVCIVVPSVVAIIAFGFNLWFTCLYHKNTYYAYTNKRLIICTGIFGVDYKSLDIKNIGASDVYVSLIDKFLKKNTGSLRFGSNSSPINGSKDNIYGFSHIVEPYETYKEIKSFIEKTQKENE